VCSSRLPLRLRISLPYLRLSFCQPRCQRRAVLPLNPLQVQSLLPPLFGLPLQLPLFCQQAGLLSCLLKTRQQSQQAILRKVQYPHRVLHSRRKVYACFMAVPQSDANGWLSRLATLLVPIAFRTIMVVKLVAFAVCLGDTFPHNARRDTKRTTASLMQRKRLA